MLRVGEVPNTLSCRVGAREGLTLATQNTLGSRKVDLLRVTDWFFPDGLDHHEIFAGVFGVQAVMQSFARRVAGLGRLPKEVRAPRRAERRGVEALVVGAGPSGMAVASALHARGVAVEVVDDALLEGGSLPALFGTAREPFADLEERFSRAKGEVMLRLGTSVVGTYGDDVLVASDEGVELLAPRFLFLAPGAHDGVCLFDGNDKPGVLSARAAGFLLREHALPAKRAVVVELPGAGPFGASIAPVLVDRGVSVERVAGEPVAVSGGEHPTSVRVRTVAGERAFLADVVIVDAPRSPAFELCRALGAPLEHRPEGFFVTEPCIGPSRFATGEVTGTPFSAERFSEQAEKIVSDALS